jgi:hypothetical protein
MGLAQEQGLDMTEAEYIQTIRKAAEGYLAVLRDPDAFDRDHDEAMRRIKQWAAIKVKLSPNTMIKLCDLWLRSDEASQGEGCPQIESEAAGSALRRQEEEKTSST